MKKIFVLIAYLLLPCYVLAEDARVRIINNSSIDVIKINVSPTYREKYGSMDLLGDNIIKSGADRMVNFDVADAENECILDIRATSSSGSNWKKRMNVCNVVNWTLND